jgi:predicted HTH transcriptional regulator
MFVINKPLNQITENDLQDLVTNQVAEGKDIDFKHALCGNSDADTKEVLHDISSFANAAGGDLIYGIEEDQGVATRVIGLVGINPDAEILRLESKIQSSISPRIPNISMLAVPLSSGENVIIIRIPRSWSAPNMVIFKNDSKFFSRNSRGKYQLDVGELRSAFLLS